MQEDTLSGSDVTDSRIMATTFRFDGRVVVVTGAGAGLGRAYALEFARRGAKVVVNDLGSSARGEGTNTQAADAVVNDIRKAGGEAVANYDSVEHGDRIIKTAIDAFGRVDILINNAGILRDVSFAKMTDGDWDLIMRVHVRGTYSVTRAAWPYFRKQKFGRVINTTSGSGLYGNFGQVNYGTAKLGIHGFTLGIAREGEKINVKANSICPVAASRMTRGVLSPEVFDIFSPDRVVPLAVLLAHEDCPVNGTVIEVGGGLTQMLRWQRAKGKMFLENFTAEDLLRHWGDITDFEHDVDYPSDPFDTLGKFMRVREEEFTKAKPKL